jgi:hypothetical protein
MNEICILKTGDSPEPSDIVSPIVEQLDFLQAELAKEGLEINKKKDNFLRKLASSLPPNTDPTLQTVDGTYVDIIIWEEQFSVTLDNEDAVSVSDFTSGVHEFEYFEQLDQDAIDYIVKHNANLYRHLSQ